MIDFVDSRGLPGSFKESIILDSATEHTNSVMCAYARNSLAYSWENGLKKAGVRARDPYQSRHTYACWSLSAGANPSFIASQMGHENAKMVYEVYGKWIGEMSKNQVDIINQNLPDALPPVCPLDQFVHSKAL